MTQIASVHSLTLSCMGAFRITIAAIYRACTADMARTPVCKRSVNERTSMSRINRPAALAFVAGMILSALILRQPGPAHGASASAAASQPAGADELAALKADVARLKEIVTDQSHVMADVSNHFANLWFAGQNENWPLAQFYADETHSHLKWAVRVIPFRKDRAGRQVDLGGILTALEQTSLKDLDDAIKKKDKPRFTAAYQQQLTNCMACHQAASKEFIHLQIPARPDSNLIDFHAPPAPLQ